MGESYFGISLSSLRVDSIPSFDLYLRQGVPLKYVLYREKNVQFTEETRKKLVDNNQHDIHVPREQRDDYFEYSSQLVADIVEREDIPIKEKSQAVYNTATNIMEDLFTTPRSSTRIRQAKETIDHTVHFLVEHEEAARSMIFLTSHDYYTYTHSVNVTIFATALAKQVYKDEMDDHDFSVMGEGFLLHDIGKSMIDPAIINKAGKLTDEEWDEMRKHPEYGRDVLDETGQNNDVIDSIVMQHHERPSGEGYPHGLKGDEIHDYAKICCIADVFDAITTVRSYRDPMVTFEALKVMRNNMGEHFHWSYFDNFVQLFLDEDLH